MKALDKTSIENNATGIGSKSVRKAAMPEVLGTVITAPAPAAPAAPEDNKETSLPEE